MDGARDPRRRRGRRSGNKKQNVERVNESNTPGHGRETTGKKSGKQKRQNNKGDILVQENDLKKLPVPVPQHLAALSQLVNSLFAKHGMSKSDISKRRMIWLNVEHLLHEEVSDCLVRLYGSSISHLGLKTSDVNIDVFEEEEAKIPKIFITLLNFLKINENYSDVKEEFHTQIPAINFTDIKSGLRCRISTKNNNSFLTSNLLKIYGELDDRVKPLCVALKLWAKICKVDCPATGTLPSYSFLLMVVHFLQQTNPPVLPVIHEMLDDESIKNRLEKENSTQDILTKIKSKWKKNNSDCVGALWLGLLRYYTNEEKVDNIIINVRQKKECSRSVRNWGKKRFAIEDPFSPKKNVARFLNKNSHYRFIVEHLKIALLYFGSFPNSLPADVEQSENGSKSSHNEHSAKVSEGLPKVPDIVDEVEHGGKKEDDEISSVSAEESGGGDGEMDDDDADDDDHDTSNNGDDGHDSDDDGNDLIDGIFAMDTINDSSLSDAENVNIAAADQIRSPEIKLPQNHVGVENCYKTPGNVERKMLEQTDVDWEYIFDESVLRKGPFLDDKCSLCGEQGHIPENCFAEEKSELIKLPDLTDRFKRILDDVCVCCANDFAITADKIKERSIYMNALEAYIRRECEGARLHLFGSSCNGFGFHESDLDLCLMFEGKKKDEIDCIGTILSLAGLLKRNPDCKDVIAITGAKVPIVKFFLVRPKLEADISLYNEVALYNTRLLASYVAIDKRVRILGCTLKIFVKLCEIGDASRGSLSSYAYILMLLHFLQQREPPVLPVLQELYDTEEIPSFVVEGHNCWFYDDLKNLSLKWKACNTESCGELWLGFLRYYTEQFDYHRHVVCVRSSKPLTKFEKMWNGKKICIEDPFVLSHNLGAGLTSNMAEFILSTFEKARERFGIPRRDIPENIQSRQQFFFDPMFLNNGHFPPTGRNCIICGKIGHFAKECPYKKTNRAGSRKNEQKKNQVDKEKKIEKEKEKKVEQNKQKEIGQEKEKKVKQNILEGDAIKSEQRVNVVTPGQSAGLNTKDWRSQSSTDAHSHANINVCRQQNVTPSSPSVKLNHPQMPPFPGGPSSPINRRLPTPDLPVRPTLPEQRVNVATPGQSASLNTKDWGSQSSTNAHSHANINVCRQQNVTPSSPSVKLNHPQMPPFPGGLSSPPINHRLPTPDLPVRPTLPNNVMFGGTARPLAPSFSQPPHSPGGIILRTRFPTSPTNLVHGNVPGFPPHLGFAHRNVVMMNSPPFYHQFGSAPQQPIMGSPQPTFRGRYAELQPIPMALAGFGNNSPTPHVFTCEALENRDILRDRVERDQSDGAIQRDCKGFSPSVLRSLQSMNISDDIGKERPTDVNAHVGTEYQEIHSDSDKQDPPERTAGAMEMNTKFSTPPNVQNFADKLLNFDQFASLVAESNPNSHGTISTSEQDQQIKNQVDETPKENPVFGSGIDEDKSAKHQANTQPKTKEVTSANFDGENECSKGQTLASAKRRRRRNNKRNRKIREGKMGESSETSGIETKDAESRSHKGQHTSGRAVEEISSSPNEGGTNGRPQGSKEHAGKDTERGVNKEGKLSSTSAKENSQAQSVTEGGTKTRKEKQNFDIKPRTSNKETMKESSSNPVTGEKDTTGQASVRDVDRKPRARNQEIATGGQNPTSKQMKIAGKPTETLVVKEISSSPNKGGTKGRPQGSKEHAGKDTERGVNKEKKLSSTPAKENSQAQSVTEKGTKTQKEKQNFDKKPGTSNKETMKRSSSNPVTGEKDTTGQASVGDVDRKPRARSQEAATGGQNPTSKQMKIAGKPTETLVVKISEHHKRQVIVESERRSEADRDNNWSSSRRGRPQRFVRRKNKNFDYTVRHDDRSAPKTQKGMRQVDQDNTMRDVNT